MYRSKFCRVSVPATGALGVFVLVCALWATAEAFDTPTVKPPAAAHPQEVEPSLESEVAPAVAPSKVAALSEPTRTVMGAPANDLCANAIPISDGVTAYDTTGADTDGPTHSECDTQGDGGVTVNDIWFQYTATCSGILTLATCNEEGGDATYDSDLVIYDNTDCGNLSLLGCNDDATGGCTASGTAFASRLIVDVVQDQVYTIRVGGWADPEDEGPGDLSIACLACGNGTCEEGENCLICPEDCADSVCDEPGGETCGTCPADCGECACDGVYPDDCDDAQIGIQGVFLHEYPIDGSGDIPICWDADDDGECDLDLGACNTNADCPEPSTCVDSVCTEDTDGDGVCDATDCSWAGLAFPFIVEGISVDTVRVSLNTNRSGGDIYITGSASGVGDVCQPDVLDIRRSLGCALSGLAVNVEHALHFESLATTPDETLWVVMRGRSGRSGSDGLDSDGDEYGFYDGTTFPAHQVGRSAIIPSQPNNSFANLAGTGNAGDWTDLHELLDSDGDPLGTFYCVDLTAEFQDVAVFDCDANPDPVGACCFGCPNFKEECGCCPTDADGNGETKAFDLAFLLGNWGEIPKDPDPAVVCLDADEDGAIGAFDLAVLLGNWGDCPDCPPVMRGFECGALGGAYLGDGTICADCDPACNDEAGDCCIANGTPGCDTSDCCHYICDLDPFCCGEEGEVWGSPCAQEANDTETGCGQIGEVCEPTQCVDAVADEIHECIRTGSASSEEGYLGIVTDEYGAHACAAPCFGGGNDECNFGDMFNPENFPPREAVFGAALFWYKTDTEQRVILSSIPNHETTYPVDFSGFVEVPEGGANVASDASGNGVNDTLSSAFSVCGPNDVSLEFTLDQKVERFLPVGAAPVSVWTQVYQITNTSGTAISFVLARQDDHDMFWVGSNADDSVGTLTNTGDIPGADRSVYILEAGRPATVITLSSPQASTYWGGKGDVDPDGPGDNGPAYGCGTDFQQWNAYGVPEGWANHVANVGYNTDGESGSSIPDGCGSGCSCDGSIGITVDVSLEPAETTCVCIQHTYGQRVPWLGGTCPEGCDE